MNFFQFGLISRTQFYLAITASKKHLLLIKRINLKLKN